MLQADVSEKSITRREFRKRKVLLGENIVSETVLVGESTGIVRKKVLLGENIVS